ncbi:hypothetical protein ACW9H6_07845 [Pseudomonas sp. SDO528_S397]
MTLPLSANNPFRNAASMTGAAGHAVDTGVNAFQGAKAQINSSAANASNQSQSADLAGGGEAGAASLAMMKMQDAQSARMIMFQGQAAMQTEQRNTMQAVSSAQTDAANKEISNVAQTAKGISY